NSPRAPALGLFNGQTGQAPSLHLRFIYGQRLAASSHPATRAGAAAPCAATAGGIRTGCCGGAAVKVGLGASAICSFSSESSGAATRKASTSFSSLVSSSSFCRKTSYTFFMLGTYVLEQGIKRRVGFHRQFVKENRHPRVQRWLSKHHDRDQDAQDQDDDRQQIDVVRQPRFSRGHCVSKEGRHEFLLHRSRRGRRCVLPWLAVRDLALLLLPRLLRGILLFAIEAERSPLGNGEF